MSFLLLAGAASAGGHFSLDFDGADDVVSVGEPIDVRGPLTIEAWVFVRDATGAGRIVANATGSTGGYQLDVHDSGASVSVRYGTGNGNRISAPFDGHLGTWTHVALAWEGDATGTLILYVDGEVAATGSSTVPITTPQPTLWIGALSAGNALFDGLIDDVRIWASALDGDTIATWRQRRLDATHPRFQTLAAAWSFDEGAGQVAASLVFSPLRDGTLGGTSQKGADDPAWAPSDVVPARVLSVGAIKARYRRAR